MSGVQAGKFITFATSFDFSSYISLCGIGGAGALLSAQVAIHNLHMSCISLDLPAIAPIALENLSKMGVSDKVEFISRDFLLDPFPEADVITMVNILNGASLAEKKLCSAKPFMHCQAEDN
jgi:hypothetical protein